MLFDLMRKRAEEVGGQFNTFVEKRAREDAETLSKLTLGLTKSRDALLASVGLDFGGASLEGALEQLETALLSADIGVATTDAVLEDVRSIARQRDGALSDDDVRSVLRGRMVEVLSSAGSSALGASADPRSPTVILVIGSNGMGKTTTIGKLATRLRTEYGQRVLLAACDTYRAAAVQQLEEWARRAHVDIVVPDEGIPSPSAAAFKAMDVALGVKPLPEQYRHSRLSAAAEEEKEEEGAPDDDVDAGEGEAPLYPYDVIVVDTSGRLANNDALTAELVKLKSTITKRLPGAPHEVLLVVDAAVGRNAVEQAKVWQRDVGVTGLAVTKLDGTSRAGFCVSVVRDLGIPVKLVGVGERLDDLRDFEPEAFVDSLLNVDRRDAAELERKFAQIAAERTAAAARPQPTAAPASPALAQTPTRPRSKSAKAGLGLGDEDETKTKKKKKKSSSKRR